MPLFDGYVCYQATDGAPGDVEIEVCGYCAEAVDENGRCLVCLREQCECCMDWQLRVAPVASKLASGETLTHRLCPTCKCAGDAS